MYMLYILFTHPPPTRSRPQVHTFAGTFGVSTRGENQEHKEDHAVYGKCEPRKCPTLLNVWSGAQPQIDNNNRTSQDLLGIEERFVTKSFPFRVFCTVIGKTVATAWDWYKYFISKDEFETFFDFVRPLVYDGMHNTIDEIPGDHGPPDLDGSPGSPVGAGRTNDGMSSPVKNSPRVLEKQHRVVPLSCVVGWKGAAKVMCGICRNPDRLTRKVCSHCSGPDAVFGLHPKCIAYKKRGQRGSGKTETDCLAKHLKDPTAGRKAFPIGGGVKKQKRP